MMEVIADRECAEVLMDPKRTVDEKLEAIRKRFMAWKAVSRSMGIPVRHAWDMTMKAVSGTVSKREQGTFKRALLSIKARASEQRRQDAAGCEAGKRIDRATSRPPTWDADQNQGWRYC
ncbi:MAG: hypothetical protein FLDDKLPJ_03736 [Phycisphaerae bacterium]|nr:hypothetical protein [Phycisphaerae bacterium]